MTPIGARVVFNEGATMGTQIERGPEILPKTVEDLAAIGCTNEEMAGILRCSKSTLLKFGDALELGRANLRGSLRRRQTDIALNAEVKLAITMLIWLGKQYLGQADKNEMGGMDGKPIPVEVTDARSKLAAKLSERTARVAGEGTSKDTQ